MKAVQRFLSGWLTSFQKEGCVGKVGLVLLSLFFLCILCSLLGAALKLVTPTPEVNKAATTQIISTPLATQTEKPAEVATIPPTEIPINTPSLTATSVYTATPEATPDPYIYLAGDWPNGVWDYIFKPEKGARGHLHLKVYLGEQKSYIFEIIGAADCSSMPSGQGYFVRYPNGDEEWKDRLAMENLELFVLKDELQNTFIDFSWKFYQCP